MEAMICEDKTVQYWFTDLFICFRRPVCALGHTMPLIHLLILTLYIVCLFTSYASPLILFFYTFFLTYIFLWDGPRPEVVKGDQTWAFLVVLFCFIVFLCFWCVCVYLCSVSLGLMYILWFMVISSGFW